MIPEDGEAATFDTVGAEQFFTSSHFEKYLELGREIAARGFEWAGETASETDGGANRARETRDGSPAGRSSPILTTRCG